jgi:cupin superfamily acireductone dioxygenase involved in methionine salvage
MVDPSVETRHWRAQRLIRILAESIEEYADHREVVRRLKNDPGALTEFVAVMGDDEGCKQRVMRLAHSFYTEGEGRA